MKKQVTNRHADQLPQGFHHFSTSRTEIREPVTVDTSSIRNGAGFGVFGRDSNELEFGHSATSLLSYAGYQRGTATPTRGRFVLIPKDSSGSLAGKRRLYHMDRAAVGEAVVYIHSRNYAALTSVAGADSTGLLAVSRASSSRTRASRSALVGPLALVVVFVSAGFLPALE